MGSEGILFGIAFTIIGGMWIIQNRGRGAKYVWAGIANIVLGLLMVVKALTHGFRF